MGKRIDISGSFHQQTMMMLDGFQHHFTIHPQHFRIAVSFREIANILLNLVLQIILPKEIFTLNKGIKSNLPQHIFLVLGRKVFINLLSFNVALGIPFFHQHFQAFLVEFRSLRWQIIPFSKHQTQQSQQQRTFCQFLHRLVIFQFLQEPGCFWLIFPFEPIIYKSLNLPLVKIRNLHLSKLLKLIFPCRNPTGDGKPIF